MPGMNESSTSLLGAASANESGVRILPPSGNERRYQLKVLFTSIVGFGLLPVLGYACAPAASPEKESYQPSGDNHVLRIERMTKYIDKISFDDGVDCYRILISSGGLSCVRRQGD